MMKGNVRILVLSVVMMTGVVPVFVGESDLVMSEELLFEVNVESQWATASVITELDFGIGTVFYEVMPETYLFWRAGEQDIGTSLDIYSVDDPEGFEAMATVLTNGKEDHFYYETGSGDSIIDFALSDGTTDFENYDITRFSLFVNDITLGPRVGGGTEVYSNVSFQAWGTAIPEPFSLLLLGFGGLVAIRRRR